MIEYKPLAADPFENNADDKDQIRRIAGVNNRRAAFSANTKLLK
jgi:hypothetical protein